MRLKCILNILDCFRTRAGYFIFDVFNGFARNTCFVSKVFLCPIQEATGGAYFTTNIEDGIALADEALRAKFESKYPAAWHRIQARRAYMRDVLGIQLKPEILPFSNIAATLSPFLLRPDLAMRVTRS